MTMRRTAFGLMTALLVLLTLARGGPGTSAQAQSVGIGHTGQHHRPDPRAGIPQSEGDTWRVYRVGEAFAGTVVLAGTTDAGGHVWIATDAGLSEFDGRYWRDYRPQPQGAYYHSVAVDAAGRVWTGACGKYVGYGAGPLVEFDGSRWQAHAEEQLASRCITDIVIDRDGHVWFATFDGVTEFDGTSWRTYREADGLVHNMVYDAFVDQANHVWFGTYDGLSEYDGHTWTTYSTGDVMRDYIVAVAVDAVGHVWTGSRYDGVSEFDGVTWHTHTTDDGLVSDDARSIVVDTEGHVWVGAVGGVSEFDGDSWRSYTQADGLPLASVYCAFLDEAGGLWFCAADGIAHLVRLGGPADDLGDLLARKQSVMAGLEETSVDIWGLQFPIHAFDESGARELVLYIQSPGVGESLSPGQVDAFARATLQEEALAELLALYSQTSADLTEAGTDMVGILLSLDRQAERALQAGCTPSNPFSGACQALRWLIARQVLRVINSFAQAATHFVADTQQQQDIRQFCTLLLDGVSVELDAGGTVRDILLGTLVRGPAVSRLVHAYVDDVQASLHQGVHSADPTYAGPDPVWVAEGRVERAELHMEGLVQQATAQAEYAHSAHQDLMRGADIGQFLTDIADLGRLTPWTALAQIPAVVLRVEHLLIDVYAIAVNTNSMSCTRHLSTRAGPLAFNPVQPVEGCRDVRGDRHSPRSTARESGSRGNAVAWQTVWSRTADSVGAYAQAVRELIAAMSAGDPRAVTDASNALDRADQAVRSTTDQATWLILDSGVPTSQAVEVLSQASRFTVDALELYLLAASYATAPDSERSVIQVEEAATAALSGLEEYATTLHLLAPLGTELGPLPIVETVTLPAEAVAGEPFEVTVVVRNVGAANADGVVVRVYRLGQDTDTVTVGTLLPDQTHSATVQVETRQPGILTMLVEVAIGDSVTASRLEQVQVVALDQEQGEPPRCTGPCATAGMSILMAALLTGDRWLRAARRARRDQPSGPVDTPQ